MKRYALFAGSQYYPSGGWNDFISSHDTTEEALRAKAQRNSDDWWHVIDLTNGQCVEGTLE